MDVQFVDVVEGMLAPQEPDGVAADRRRGSDRDDPASEGRDLQRLRDRLPGSQQRDAELDQPRADGDVEAPGQSHPPPLVADDDLARHVVTGHDALVREHQVDVVRPRAEEEGNAHDDQDEGDRAGDHPLNPPEHDPAASPTVAATTTSAPAGRTVRAVQWAAATRAAPTARETCVHHTTARTTRRPPPAVTCVLGSRRARRRGGRLGGGGRAGEAGLGQAHAVSRRLGGATSSRT